ncbi:hypothetical protein [Micromonospora sp. HM5-17]|uniref:hypothetical protein n=1 Tax=Micromonospora sp. HM5-17 TaxID=2487710 RepID=UPI000F4650D5|nr:hypothetical protein [Micromonospora sp. HM5-17]ROT27128.1 hypothetical protein EF879_24350 [Micromonospora sp. HM5-17]
MSPFGLFSRTRRLPASLRPALERDERVLDWARVGDGGEWAVVVTTRGLWLPDLEGQVGWLPGVDGRLGWHEIHKAVWSGRELTVVPAQLVEERAGYRVLADGASRTYLLLDPGNVPHQVRVRVTRSVAYTAHRRLPGGGVRVVARRVPGIDGLTWTVRYDPGTPSDDDAVIAETDQLVAAAQAGTDPDL